MSEETNILKNRIRQLETELSQVREKMSLSNAILESGQLCVWIVDRDFNLINFNQNFFLRLLPALEEPTVAFEQDGEIVTADTQTFWHDCYREVLQGKTLNREVRVTYQGHAEWKEVFLNPVYNTQVDVIAISGIAYNVTEKKESRKQLATSEEKFRNIFESFQDLYFRIDFSGRIIMLSPSVKEITGYSEDELLGKDITNYYLYDSKTKSLLAELVKSRSVRNFEAGIIHHDGRVVPTICNIRVIREDGRHAYIEGVARDITELKKTTEELQHSKELAEQSLVIKEKFLANISHEIRTPLNGVMGMLHLIDPEELSAENRNRFNSVRKSAELLLDVLNDLLDISKIEAGKMTLNESIVNISELFNNLHSLYEGQAIKKGITLKYHIGSEVPKTVVADEVKVVQIYANLISNAIKFTDEGGQVDIHINVEAQLTGKKIKLKARVVDNGPGISTHDQDKLFKSFTQIDSGTTKQFKGTGLGLYLSKKMTEIMYGEIGVNSTPGIGSEFWFTFAAHEQKEEFTDSISAGAIPAQLMVMVVDDNATNREVAAQILTKKGCQVTKAYSGQQAIEYAKKQKFDHIFMDIQMPDLDGIETTAHIRRIPLNNETPIIAMTAYSMDGDKNKFISAGMDGYIAKPINPRALIDSLTGKLSEERVERADIVLDRSTIDGLLKYMDLPTLLSSIDEFLTDTDSQLNDIEQLHSQEYGHDIKVFLHTLKGNAGTIGAASLANFAEYLENEVKLKNYHIFESNLAKLRSGLVDFEKAVKTELH